MDKIIKLSELFEVTTDYLLKDDAEDIFGDLPESFGETELFYAHPEELSARKPSVRRVSLEEGETFMALTEKMSSRIAGAVSLFILSPIPLILLGGAAEYRPVSYTHLDVYKRQVLGLLQSRGDWLIKSNAELGEGYSDIVICTPDRVGIIIELKYADDGNLEKGCLKALEQIEDRKYAVDLERRRMNKVFKYGIAFCEKECKVVLAEY